MGLECADISGVERDTGRLAKNGVCGKHGARITATNAADSKKQQ